MRKLDRYIGASVFWSIIAVLLVVLGLGLLLAFIDEWGSIEGSFGRLDAFR